MAYPKRVKGTYVTILMGNGATPEVFVPLCGLSTRSLTAQINGNDEFVKDCADPEDVPVRAFLPTGKQWDVSGSGVIDRNSIKSIIDAQGYTKNYRFMFGEPANDQVYSGYWAGPGVLTNVSFGGNDDAFATVELTVVSDGLWEFVEVSSGGVPTPQPTPTFTTPPSISPNNGAVGNTFTANDGVSTYTTGKTRRWLLDTTAIGTGTTVTPNAVGSLTLEVTASGPNGSTTATSAAVTVAALPTLTIAGPLTFTSGAPAGTLVATIGNVPAGSTPTLTPNDGRLAIAGDATNGWKVVVGLTNASAGSIALSVAANGANSASATVTVEPTGNVLSTAAIDDKAFGRTGYSDAAIYGSGTTLPAGDWVLHIAVKLPFANGSVGNPNAYDTPIFNMYTTTGTNWMGSTANLCLNFMSSTSSQTTDPGRGCYILSGKDDAGNWLATQANRVLNPYWGTAGANIPYISGPYQQTPESVPESIFVQKTNGRIQLWIVRPGSTAVLHDDAASSFGAMTASTTRIGVHPQGTRANSTTFQRFFVAAGSLTAAQMEAVAQGVDPRQYLGFNQPTDRLAAWKNTGVNNDLVGSGTFDIAGNTAPLYAAQATPLIPTTVTAEMPRVFLESNQVKACSSAAVNSDLYFDGRVTGFDDDIYLQVVDFTTKTNVVQAWTKVATSVNGAWSGKINGEFAKLQWYDLQIRKGLNGTVYTLNRRFGCGIVMDGLGQSLNEKKRMSSPGTSPNLSGANFVSLFSRAKSDSGSTQGTTWRGWYTGKQTGYGEARLASIIADKLQRPVGSAMSAVEGSAMNAWQPGNETGFEPMARTARRIKPNFYYFAQGHGNTADNASVYIPKLESMFAAMKQQFTWDWKFIIEPLCNNGNLPNDAGAFQQIRVAQHQYALDNVARGVWSVGGVNDLKLVDTVHATSDNAGMGKQAERIARTVNWLMSAETTSSIGPRPTSVTVSGVNVDVTFAHNGGTALKAAQTGDITGFDVALASDSSFTNKLAISSVTVLDATRVRIVLNAAPGAAVRVRYQWGNPGPATTPLDANGYIPAVTNPLYDDRTPALNTTLGFPAMFTLSDIVSA